jgi:hypothetical protein
MKQYGFDEEECRLRVTCEAGNKIGEKVDKIDEKFDEIKTIDEFDDNVDENKLIEKNEKDEKNRYFQGVTVQQALNDLFR